MSPTLSLMTLFAADDSVNWFLHAVQSLSVLLVFVGLVLMASWFSIRYIPNNYVGIVEKLWSRQRLRPRRAHYRPHGEAGFQAELLRGGVHFGLWRWQYRIHKVRLVTVSQGKIGYVYARDGEPLPPSQTLGRVVPCNNFQDARDVPRRQCQRRQARSPRPARPPAGDSPRGRVRDQPGAVRRHHRRRDLHTARTSRSTAGSRRRSAIGSRTCARSAAFEPVVVGGPH